MANYIPGINVGQLFGQLGAWRRGDFGSDYDIFDGISVRGGARSPENGALVGRTSRPKSNVTTKTAPSADTSMLSFDGGNVLGLADSMGAAQADPDAAIRSQLRGEISGRGAEIDALYNDLFTSLDALLKARDAELETQYGEQSKKAADQYTAAIPEIENSYAAIGSGDSTDNSDAKDKAKAGHDETQKTIGKNKEQDKAKLGAYGNEQRAKIGADKEAASRNVARAGETEDVDALRGMRNDLETNLSNAKVTKATLGTDGQARRDLSAVTSDGGRFEAATNALDSIIKSSMSGAVKEAAIKAVVDNGGLSDEEKAKVNAQYGNVYAEQAAL